MKLVFGTVFLALRFPLSINVSLKYSWFNIVTILIDFIF